VHRSRRIVAAVIAAAISSVLFLFVTATPAGAVVGGTDDTANHFENVGMLQLRIEDEWFGFCSGTLVAEDVVLTAAHCTDFFGAPVGDPDGFGTDDLRVTFDPQPDAGSTSYAVDHLVVNPAWFTAGPCRGNSKSLCLAPPAEDIALVWLKDAVSGVDPAPIADAGYLDTLDLTSETFTVVGYGLDGFVTGTIISPRAVVIDDGTRSYRDVSVITTHDAFPDRFVKITRSTCFGDSGGPLFHGGIVVGINTWTFSYRCSGPNFAYRTDSEVAQAFLDTYL
jgi:Trypsin